MKEAPAPAATYAADAESPAPAPAPDIRDGVYYSHSGGHEPAGEVSSPVAAARKRLVRRAVKEAPAPAATYAADAESPATRHTSAAGSSDPGLQEVPDGQLCLFHDADYGRSGGYTGADKYNSVCLPRSYPVSGSESSFVATPNHLDVDSSGDDEDTHDRASSWVNKSGIKYCAFDINEDGEIVLLWEMYPDRSSKWVGDSKNDRTDFIRTC